MSIFDYHSSVATKTSPGFFEKGGFFDQHRFGFGAGIGGLIGIAGYWIGEKLFCAPPTEEEYDAALDRLKNEDKRKQRQFMDKKFKRQHPVAFYLLAAAIIIGLLFFLLFFINTHPLSFHEQLILCVSIVTFLFFGYDKQQSKRGAWRVPETVLHILSFAGGFFGAILGIILFRHKTQKHSFAFVFVLSFVLHLALYIFL